MRASTADRDRSVEAVKTGFAEGRLTAKELDLRLGQVLVSRYFEELMALTADLPVGPFGRLPAHRVTSPLPGMSRRAVAARVCVAAGLVLIAAIALLIAA